MLISQTSQPVNQCTPYGQVARGFTLVELLIALLLGALVIGGIATVFISSQQTNLRLTAYHNTQEALRYGSHAITRLIRGANSVAPSSATSLVFQLDPFNNQTRNCLGQVVGATEFNRICQSGADVLCQTSTTAIAPGEPCVGTALVSGIAPAGLTFAYTTGGRDTYTNMYVNNPGNWDNPDAGPMVSGVRVSLTLTDGPTVTFTGTLRAQLPPPPIRIFGGS